MKFALIGQDIPTLLPTLLADLLYAGHEAAEVAIHEHNPAMRDVLQAYGDAVIRRSGLPAKLLLPETQEDALRGADCVIYAGDCMPMSRFRMDREALGGVEEDDPGLTEQARVNGGIGGLMHTLRAGDLVLGLIEDMEAACPDALVICLGQPVARMTELLLRHGFRAYGLGRSPMRASCGVDAIVKKLKRKPADVLAETAGLTGFAFLYSLKDAKTGEDLLPAVTELAADGGLGRLAARWLDWYGAVPVGEVTDHAEFLPAQDDYMPDADPVLGETVEQRKARILRMNTVGREGASSRDGAMAQVELLSQASPVRPVQLALALLRGEDLTMPAVTRRNAGELPQLPQDAVIEADLTLRAGKEVPHGRLLVPALADICADIADTNRLAALAAEGDRTALRECVEQDPALAGLDRLYCQDLVDKLIELHSDVLGRFAS